MLYVNLLNLFIPINTHEIFTLCSISIHNYFEEILVIEELLLLNVVKEMMKNPERMEDRK